MSSAGMDKIDLAEPAPDDVRVQLKLILQSDEFRLPARARQFLQFVVEETLDGRHDYLKAFTIAQTVFGRDANFDAQNDPCVRIEAGRLRRELERYYLVAGADDPVIITIPKGGYVPVFRLNAEAQSSSANDAGRVSSVSEHTNLVPERIDAPSKPAKLHLMKRWPWLALAGAVIASFTMLAGMFQGMRSPEPKRTLASAEKRLTVVVESFDTVSGGTLASSVSQGITDEIIDKLVPFKDIVVLSDDQARRAGDRQDPPLYSLQGSVRLEGDKLRSSARLIRLADGAVIWANNYDADLRTQGILQTETAFADDIATAVARPFSVIFQTDVANRAGSSDAYSCTLSYYSYRSEMTRRAHDIAKTCLQQAIEKKETDSSLAALLSLTLLDEFRFPFQLGTKPTPATLKTAKDLAERAVQLDPQNARALQALMLANFFGSDIPGALRAGEAAYAINPNDTEVAGEYGLRLSMSGKWDTGCELISAAVRKNAGPDGYYEVGMALCAFMRGDAQAAELWSRMSDLNYNPMHRLVLMSILGALGKYEQAREQLDWLNTNSPALIPNVRQEVVKRLASPKDQERFFAGLRAGGLVVEDEQAAN
ncbi:membrane protein [Rhizobium mesoamericanum]|nr:membrane protein [Rhizobium mesoamericanum]